MLYMKGTVLLTGIISTVLTISKMDNIEVYGIKGMNDKKTISPWIAMKFTKYYNIFIQVGLTGIESGQEEDYMSLDLVAEIASLDDKIEFEVLSHGVM